MKPLRTGCTRAAALAWLTRAVGSAASGGLAVLADRLQLAGKRQRLRQFDHLHGLGRIGGLHGGRRIVVGESPAAAYAWRSRRAPMRQQKRQARKAGMAMRKPDACTPAALRSAGVIVQAPSTS
jgi:hypothetical protein